MKSMSVIECFFSTWTGKMRTIPSFFQEVVEDDDLDQYLVSSNLVKYYEIGNITLLTFFQMY